jgi:UDP-glucose 4-epimerase
VRVVVTGALGYIGSQLVRELGAAWPGAEIVMLDNLATERYASLYDLPANGRYEFVEEDVLTADLKPLVAGADAVIHLAALTNGTGCEPQNHMQRVNVVGTERVARACAAARVPMLFPSTTSIYGTSGTVTEDCDESSLHPQTPYAEWKLQSEQMLQGFGHCGELQFTILRLGTVFGPSVGMQFHTAVNRFCWQAIARQPLEVWRTAIHQYRPYLEVRDAVRAMLFTVAERKFDRRIYNVLSVNATVQQVVDALARHVPDVTVAYVDSPHMNRWSYCVDNTRFRRLGFDFAGTLALGVGDTIARLARTQSGRINFAGRER